MTGLILLAAGASTRLGKPKQNLVLEGKTLLQRAIHTALDSVCTPVVVVLRPDSKILLPAETTAAVTIVQNQEWEEGMAASIRCGLAELITLEPRVASCIFIVCDQPFVDAALLNTLVQVKEQDKSGMVASAYKDTLGTPVLFDKLYFPELLSLRGQEGAKKIILKHRKDVATVPFPAGAIDIDTAADYADLLQTNSDE